MKLIDAEFVWTEPHSKRIKLNLTVQKEAFGVVLQQSFIVCFIVEAKTCEDCIMESIEHSSKMPLCSCDRRWLSHPIAHA